MALGSCQTHDARRYETCRYSFSEGDEHRKSVIPFRNDGDAGHALSMSLGAVVARLQTFRVDVDRLAAAWDTAVKILGIDRLLELGLLLEAVWGDWGLSQMILLSLINQ